MTRHASERFDVEKFWDDVNEWRERHKVSGERLAMMIMMDPVTLRHNLNYRQSLSLKTAAELAWLCDLDLNSYILKDLCASL